MKYDLQLIWLPELESCCKKIISTVTQVFYQLVLNLSAIVSILFSSSDQFGGMVLPFLVLKNSAWLKNDILSIYSLVIIV